VLSNVINAAFSAATISSFAISFKLILGVLDVSIQLVKLNMKHKKTTNFMNWVGLENLKNRQ
jgi:hypothetical protein